MPKPNNSDQNFVPALGANWATRFYDPLVRLTTKEYEFKRKLIDQAELDDRQTILDLACGTGTLSVAIAQRFPTLNVHAIDADEKVLNIARGKAEKSNLAVQYQKSFADQTPFDSETFDHIFSTLFFHHLTLAKKKKTLAELFRVIKTGGAIHIADYGKPANNSQKALSTVIRVIDGDETTRDNFKGILPALIRESGFKQVKVTGEFRTILGTIRAFQAKKL